jgi:hypothetical protein
MLNSTGLLGWTRTREVDRAVVSDDATPKLSRRSFAPHQQSTTTKDFEMRRTTNNRRSELPNEHYSFGPPIKVGGAASKSCEVEAVGNRKFLEAQPHVRAFLHPLSAREVQAVGLQKDQVVVVARLDNRRIARLCTCNYGLENKTRPGSVQNNGPLLTGETRMTNCNSSQ